MKKRMRTVYTITDENGHVYGIGDCRAWAYENPWIEFCLGPYTVTETRALWLGPHKRHVSEETRAAMSHLTATLLGRPAPSQCVTCSGLH